ncbi:MAG: sigma-70 family RNA polymerase sigma factor [Planctomycetota bacterium]
MDSMEEAFRIYQSNPTEEALTEVLTASQGMVYSVCHHVLGDVDEVNDASQEVLIEIARGVGRIQDGEHFRRWACRIAFSNAMDERRKRRSREKHEGRVPMREESASRLAEVKEAVHEAMERLEDDLRALVVEHHFEGRTLTEIARARGVSVPAVSQKLDRAHGRLRENMARLGFAAFVPNAAAYLGSLAPVAPPAGLVPGAGAGIGGWIIGGIVMKLKIAAAGVAIAALGYGGYRMISPSDAPAPKAGKTVPATAQSKRKSAPRSVPVEEPKPEEKLVPITPPREIGVESTPPMPASEEPRVTDKEFMASLMKALMEKSEMDRWPALRQLGISLTDDDFRKVLEHAKMIGEQPMESLMYGIFIQWAESDPSTSAAWLLKHFSGEIGRSDDLLEILKPTYAHWARRDVAEATLSARQLPAGENRDQVLAMLTVLENPSLKASEALMLPEGKERDRMILAVGEAWGQSDPVAAWNWVTQLPAGNVKTQAFQKIGVEWARKDFRAAANAASALAKSDGRDRILVEVARAGAKSDPAVAVDIFDRMAGENPEMNPGDLMEILKKWFKSDPGAAMGWVDRRFGANDSMRKSLVEGLSVHTVKGAFSLAETIGDPLLREQAFRVIAQNGGRTDPMAVAEFLDRYPALMDKELLMRMARNLAGANVEDALKWIGQAPGKFSGAGLTQEDVDKACVEVIATWAREGWPKDELRRWIQASPMSAEMIQRCLKEIEEKSVEDPPAP